MTTVIHDTDIGTIFRLTIKDSDGTVIDVVRRVEGWQ